MKTEIEESERTQEPIALSTLIFQEGKDSVYFNTWSNVEYAPFVTSGGENWGDRSKNIHDAFAQAANATFDSVYQVVYETTFNTLCGPL